MRIRTSLTILTCAAALVGCDASLDQIAGPSASAGPQHAAQQVPSLMGETFVADVFEFTGGCDPNTGVGSYEFTASGLAEGPYPGTFTEQGTLVFNGDGTGTFQAQFTISSTTEIQGNKQGSQFTGTCNDAAAMLSGQAEYAAEIDGFNDAGIAPTSVLIGAPTFAAASAGFLNEEFLSSSEQTVVVLDPPFAENPVGTSHTVTASVFSANTGQPAEGVVVQFDVSSPSGFSAAGSCVTDSNGQCSFTYQGPMQADVHTIQGCAETTGAAQCGLATKVFIVPASTPGKVTGGGHVLHEGVIHGVSFGFNAQLKNGRFHGNGVVVDHRTGTRIKLLDVTSLLIIGTHATFSGNAEIDGVPTRYTIDVDDLAEPGRMLDTFKIVTTSGYVVAGVLSGGNIQIHKSGILPGLPR